MKTYEEFLVFLEEHLNHMSDFVPVTNKDFHSICYATARFLLCEPFRWEKLIVDWPQLPKVEKPSEEDLIAFYNEHKGLNISFKKELNANDLPTLYKGYNLLHPILVSKDEFLTAIFREDIPNRRYKKIFKASERKITRIIQLINGLKEEDGFHRLMKKFTSDLEGFSLTLINNKRLLDQVVSKFMGLEEKK